MNWRRNDKECKEREKIQAEDEHDIRLAAEVHRQTRRQAQTLFKPGAKIIDEVNKLEQTVLKLVEGNLLDAGRGFPCGTSLNYVAAHWSPNPGDSTILQ